MDPDAKALRSLALGYRLSQALYVFAELGIADTLAAGPATAADLALKAGAHEGSLTRLLRLCRAMELVDELPDGTFELTARGTLVRTDVPGSQWPRVRAAGEAWQWDSWGRLLESVTTGRSAFEQHYGSNSFEYFDKTPGVGETMMGRTTEEARRRGAAIAEAFDFRSVRCVADIGGGRGAILGEILSRHKHLGGVLVDLPYAVAGAQEVLAGYGVAERCEVVASDFRTDLPGEADVCLLSAVVHSWSDADSSALIGRCLARYGKVLVVDEVVDTVEAPIEVLLKDLQLMVFSDGRHRALEEYREMFAAAGARLAGSAPIGKNELLMEGVPAS